MRVFVFNRVDFAALVRAKVLFDRHFALCPKRLLCLAVPGRLC